MGYTHYWQPKPISAKAWKVVKSDMERLFDAAKPTLCREYDEPQNPPLCDTTHLIFNGKESAGHETFWIERNGNEWACCKTAQKPYDAAVCAALIYLSTFHGYHVTSDGDASDWQAGLDLARKAWPAINGHLAIPSTLGD